VGAASIFNGAFIKLLKDQLRFKDTARIITGTYDPSTVATDAEKGSIFMRQGSVGEIFVKLDNGTTTNWRSVSVTGLEFTLANNQASPANVTGFTLDPLTNKGFSSDYVITRTRLSTAMSEDTAFYGNLGTAFDVNVNAMAVQSDGKIVVVGTFTNFNGNTRNRIVRLNADGTEDTAFYTNVGFGLSDEAYAVAIQSDGKILVGGVFTNFDTSLTRRLVRLNTDGTEDTAFTTNLSASFNGDVYKITLQSDGKILVGGDFTNFNSNGVRRLVRLNTNGTEDAAFTANLGTGFNGIVRAFAVQSDDKILVGGNFTSFDVSTTPRIVRLNSNGTEDVAFTTATGNGFDGAVYDIAIQSSGKIVVGGDFNTFHLTGRNYLMRLNTDGTGDYPFNIGSGFSDRVEAVTLESDNIFVGGAFGIFSGNARGNIVKLGVDGAEDTNFYSGLGTGFNFIVNGLTLQADGKLLVGGAYSELNGNARQRLVRLAYSPIALIKKGQFQGYYNAVGDTWTVGGEVSIGDDVGVDFTMTPAGQLQYTSTNITGTIVEESMLYTIKRL